ncbi:MAG: dihydrofolate synthase/folylpolyglutamate synthase [Cognaticolwellia sp.]|jgi:dihydrofolate synthase/folylpolyglutamate synthase
MGLERVGALLDFMGNPHLAVPSMHVGGTNGKGSVSAMIAACQQAAERRVGLMISPHLQQVNERLSISGHDIPDVALERLLDQVHARAQYWAAEYAPELGEGPPLTYFELIAVAGFSYFADCHVDLSVIEVGLGGRLDATNVVQPKVSVITTVALDHMDRLGPDLASIAGEKAGILKPGVPVVVGRLAQDAMRVVRLTAHERGCPMFVLGQDFEHSGNEGGLRVHWTHDGQERRVDSIRLGLAGAHQKDNAAIALRALDLLPPELRVPPGAMREGLAQVRHSGRMEWLSERVLVDGAHNAAGAQALASFLADLPRTGKRTLLLGASADKDIRSIASALASQFDLILTTRCAHERAADAGDVAQQLVDLSVPVMPAGDIEDALQMALEGEGLVVVAGSLFLVGAARDLLG